MRKYLLGCMAVVTALTLTACSAKQQETVVEKESVVETVVLETEEAAKAETIQVEESTQQVESIVEEQEAIVTEPIKELFAKSGLKAGTCLSDFMIRDKKCAEIIKENFNSITLENHMKPDYILDHKASKLEGDIVVAFNDSTKKLLDWCKENGMSMRGHTIVWHSQTPSWIFYENFDTSAALVNRNVMLARMESYIKQTFAQLEQLGYIDMFYAYDVVNEAWMEDGSMRESLWLETIGEDYLWYAFYYANQYAPEHIDLYYNDYNEQYKTDTLYNFVQTLVDEEGNYLIDGIGFQAHLYTEDNMDDYFNTVEKLASTGLKLNLTELDVCLGSWPEIKKPTEENLKAQGQYYYNLIHGLLAMVEEGKVNMDALTFWGFADHLSWRGERNPLLFDSKYDPKYAYYGALQMKEYAGFDAE